VQGKARMNEEHKLEPKRAHGLKGTQELTLRTLSVFKWIWIVLN